MAASRGVGESDAQASGTRLLRGLDRLIPDALLADADTRLRSRVLVLSSFGLGLLAFLANVVRFVTAPHEPGIVIAFGVIALLLVLPWLQRWTGSHRIAGGVLVTACIVTFPIFHILLGIFPAPALVLFATVPLIAAFFVGIGFGFLSAAVLATTAILLRLALPTPTGAQVELLAWTFASMAAAAPLMTALLAAAYERARLRNQLQLQEQSVALEEARARAEAESRSKSEFLRHVSHELRTPLNAILGYGELVQEELAEAGQERLAADVDKIRGASGHLLSLINDLLDISRIEAGAIELVFAEVDLASLLAQVRDTALPLASTNHNTLVVAVPEDLPPLVTDEQRLRQILLNLVGNACKFTDRGRIVLSSALAGDSVVLRVRDTGVGMTPEQRVRLFEPFVQVHPSPERRRQGTGLGLSLSRRLVEQLGGAIEVTSEPGRGTEFSVRLPLRRPA